MQPTGRTRNNRIGTSVWTLLVLIIVSGEGRAQSQSWPQWGGPNRNFKAETKGLASAWPATGPRRLWSRELGEGYSAIVADNSKLYTMYRKGDQEIIIALDSQSGKTAWEYSYPAPHLKDMNLDNLPGPNATPLLAGNYVYAAGMTSKLHCLDRETGKLVWSHDLWKEFKGTFIDTGYSCSPVAYKGTVILTLGGPGQAVVAFNQKDGTIAWEKQDFASAPASPILINLDGQDQLVAFMATGLVGFDPNNGDLLWDFPHTTRWDLNISTPVWGDDHLLFCSSAYDAGSRVVQLERTGAKTTAKELWYNKRVRVHKDNAVRIGDYIYGSSGDFGPAFFTAVEAKTGKIMWQDRSFAKASFLYADGKFIILDEDGNLALATPSAEGLKVHSKTELLKSRAWTVPTLVGTRLYVRDRKTIVALELG
jgi:outer membrane protein assembly factor BamB